MIMIMLFSIFALIFIFHCWSLPKTSDQQEPLDWHPIFPLGVYRDHECKWFQSICLRRCRWSRFGLRSQESREMGGRELFIFFLI